MTILSYSIKTLHIISTCHIIARFCKKNAETLARTNKKPYLCMAIETESSAEHSQSSL